ncbi:MAG TPA: hypothetical protein VFT22_40890 [Kofleriaceae bacterium]|nr:hypothetical protein [Kofleriaceae bacterium]
MSRLRFLSSTSLALLAGAVPAAGCGDDACGPGGAPDSGLVASTDSVMLTYGQLRGRLNGDCPGAGAPEGLVSMTISGMQDGGDGFITMCVERPDLLARQSQALGNELAGVEVRLVDVNGNANNCSFAIDRSQPPEGTATSTGLCGNGADAAGFALVVDGSLSLTRTCGATVDSVRVTLRGRVAVAGPS